jgi:hypothetical protein
MGSGRRSTVKVDQVQQLCAKMCLKFSQISEIPTSHA